jgi:SAM-dependent methyltransferase
LQQGADMGGMAARLTALNRPLGTRYLEIGCGFGLSLDFARRALGWDVVGLDPSPFAATGRDLLNLPIELRYFSVNDPLSESFDVVHASEVLEHVEDPLALLRTLRRALRPQGTLILTTPSAEAITPATSEGLLIPLLSAGWHLVIQSASSLERLLLQAGFENVRVTRHGAQLIATSGPTGGNLPTSRAAYLEWLEKAARVVPGSSDLGLGLFARLYRERSSAGDMRAAAAAWHELDAAISSRYGRGLDSFSSVAEETKPLSELASHEPLCLAGVLLHKGLEALQREEPAEPLLIGAVAAAARLRAALRTIGSDDGDAEDVAFAATAELIVIAAMRGDTGIADRIEQLMAVGGSRHAEAAARRAFVNLVNRGELSDARRIDAAMNPDWCAISETGKLQHAEASIVFCRSVMELQLPDGRWAEAVEWLYSLRGALVKDFKDGETSSPSILYWPATTSAALGLRLMGDEDAASTLLSDAETSVGQLIGFPPRPLP